MREMQRDPETAVIPVDDLPPPDRAHKRLWEYRLQPLVENPGQWFLIKTGKGSESAVNNLRNRQVKIPYPDHEWQFAVRTVDGVKHAYGRYLGERDGE